ncbi:Fe-S cluster assembly protein SufD [Pseudoglutamicibacter cumminsii]|uniref:Fe-S cluster assembly protein SufD n=1 Tax=Pseudoglutamicibacter cumminsii TaxID=156979 RepID=A0ABX5LCN2_9MICC|nr:Fe-S cluster assembly protein SufD [Pseudoglutamicibacter cumminsii]PWI28632.1 Fe-S cluster assembly protein SufD [Pseudoglutamicibacter cumminsii]
MSETTSTQRPQGAPLIAGFTEEGEDLSPMNADQAQGGSPIGGDAVKSHSHGGAHAGQVSANDTSRAGRATSFNVEDFPQLTGREEDFRFTPLRRLKGLHKDELTGSAPSLSQEVLAGTGEVRIEQVAQDHAAVSFMEPEDRLSANAYSAAKQVELVTVPAETDGLVTKLTLHGEHSDPAGQHITVVAEPGAKATVVFDHVGSAVLTQHVEYDIKDGAELTIVSLQNWEDDAVHAANMQARIGAEAKLKHVVVTFGGDLVRLTPSVRFDGERGEAYVYGLYFTDAGQHQEHRLFINHASANCTSDALYKGALQGDGAHSVWVGDVLIPVAGEGTTTYEANRNLVLSEGARADSVPNLEIETGVIEGAGHAATTGRFDDEHLFYLMARGIDEKTARRLVVRGFLNEIIQKIDVPEIEDSLNATIEAELAVNDN